jgi:VWFA-related protein
MIRSTLAAGALLALSSSPAVGQDPMSDPRVEIVSPAPGSYVSGLVTLRAAITTGPDAVVRHVQFFADGTLVCTAEAAPWACEWDAGGDVRAHQLRAVLELLDGRRASGSLRTRSIGYAERVDVESVLVPVLVSDGDRFVSGLDREAFRLYEDGRPQAIDTVSSENLALDLVVAVDISESMAPSLPRVKQAVRRFLDSLRPDDRVTLLAFNENVFTLARRDSTPAAWRRALDRLAPWGGTALYDVLLKGMDLLTRTTGRRALVVFSDGYDQSSRTSLESATRAVEAGDAALYVIVLGQTAQAQQSRRTIEQLAQSSGGRAFFRNRLEDLDGDFDLITEELFNQYLIAYSPTNASRDETWRRIKVEVVGRKYRVRARQGYRAVARAADR